MSNQARPRFSMVVAVVGLIVSAGPRAASASPPANDNFVDATAITSLPFTDSGDLSGTTTEPGEPISCIYQPQTVWYAFTASSAGAIKVDMSGSQGGAVFTVYQSSGGGFGGLGYRGCFFGGSMVLSTSANTTYYVQVGSYFYGSAHVQLSVEEIPPPPNDDFAGATAVGALPFAGTADMTAATTEPGEPVTPGGLAIVGSAWYVFTATGVDSLTASTSACCASPALAVYTGSSVASLTEVKSVFGGTLTFMPTAGTTYYFQVGRNSSFGSGSIQMPFQLAVTPPPVVQLGFSPFDPSTFETTTLYSFSYDPVGAGLQSWDWDLGDGSSATGGTVTHRYATDGDYTVVLTVTTVDGRSGFASQVVHVRTHDVAITKFSAPNAASAGQTRQVSVGLQNGRYPESVQIQLFKSVPGSYNSFQLVGTLTQFVPVVGGNRTVPFDFSYTFTPDDAAVGKVTFQAIATIVNARDAQSADNVAISPPAKVNH